MSKLKIGIVISTTRATRFGHKPAEWVKSIAAERSDMTVEIRGPARLSHAIL